VQLAAQGDVDRSVPPAESVTARTKERLFLNRPQDVAQLQCVVPAACDPRIELIGVHFITGLGYAIGYDEAFLHRQFQFEFVPT